MIGCNDGTLIIFDDYAEAAPHIIRDYRGNIAKITSFMLNQVRWLLVLYSVGVYIIPPGRTKWRFSSTLINYGPVQLSWHMKTL